MSSSQKRKEKKKKGNNNTSSQASGMLQKLKQNKKSDDHDEDVDDNDKGRIVTAPHMQSLPSFIKDTTQLLNELQGIHVNTSDWLVCIPHSEGKKACFQAF